jgi:hypothetical protein
MQINVLGGVIWDWCPKSTYVEQEAVALVTYLAVLKFNDGDFYFLKIFEDLDIIFIFIYLFISFAILQYTKL